MQNLVIVVTVEVFLSRVGVFPAPDISRPDFKDEPAGPYVRGFLGDNTEAEYLYAEDGDDVDELVEHYNAAAGTDYTRDSFFFSTSFDDCDDLDRLTIRPSDVEDVAGFLYAADQDDSVCAKIVYLLDKGYKLYSLVWSDIEKVQVSDHSLARVAEDWAETNISYPSILNGCIDWESVGENMIDEGDWDTVGTDYDTYVVLNASEF